jgi:DNA-binding NtrC family response regulator
MIERVMIKLTMYIIDDEEEVVNALRAIFKPNKRFRLRVHTSVSEALADMQKHPPQLVICDHLMPERSGLELLAELKKRYPRLRTVLLTGHELDQSMMDGMEKGAVDVYIGKPWIQAALEETVQRLAREVAVEGTHG